MMNRHRVGQLLPGLMGISAGIVAIGNAPQLIRLPLVLGFLAICPGVVLVRIMKLDDQLHRLTLSVALSLVLSSLVSLIVLYAGIWSPNGILIVLIAITVGATLFPIIGQPGSWRWANRRGSNERE